MSILFFDDPQYYGTANLATRFAAISSNFAVSPGNGRFGTASWRTNVGNVTAQVNLGVSSATGTIGISVRFGSLPPSGTNAVLLAFLDSGTIQVSLALTNGGTLQVYRGGSGGTLLASSTNVLSTNVWYRLEIQTTINNSTGVIEVRVNGSNTGWIPSTGSLNTRSSTNNSFNQVTFGWTGSGTSGVFDWNDLFVTDSNSPNAGFLGDKRSYLLLPSADSSVTWANTWAAWAASTVMAVGQQIKDSNGNIQQVQSITSDFKTGSGSHPTWATTGGSTTVDNHVTWVVVGSGSNPGAHNWMAVSEPASDGDNSYNTDSNPGDIDLFTVPSLPAGAQNIAAVKNTLYVRKDYAGTRTVASQIKSSGTTATGASIALSTTYVYTDAIQETDPNTSAAWTASGVNAALFGYKEVA